MSNVTDLLAVLNTSQLQVKDNAVYQVLKGILDVLPVIQPLKMESGTWLPVLNFTTTNLGVTYSIQLGSYVKIGNLVFITGHVALTSKGTVTGAAKISGLPFKSDINSVSGIAVPFLLNFAAAIIAGITFLFDAGSTDIFMFTPVANGVYSI